MTSQRLRRAEASNPPVTRRRAATRTLLEGADGSRVRRTVLPNGLRIVTEQVPGVRSVSFGVWVGVGSRDEAPTQTGSAHFLEIGRAHV